MPPDLGSGASAEKLAHNYQIIRNLVSHLNDENWYEDTECELFNIGYVERGQYRTLFENLGDFFEKESDRNREMSKLPQATSLHSFIRTLVYSAYFCRCIVLTRVTTEDESAAFDIFDALNTTGEPLTALETLKPLVIRFENSRRRYRVQNRKLPLVQYSVIWTSNLLTHIRNSLKQRIVLLLSLST